MAQFTPTQGRYLAFIHAYTELHGIPPAESEIAAALCVSPPSVNQMVKTLEKKGLLLRQPGQARALEILVPADEIPQWSRRRPGDASPRLSPPPSRPRPAPKSPPAKLYVIQVFLRGGPVGKAFEHKVISRTIEIRGDQTLGQLHEAIFQAHDRWDEHHYEFQLGKRPNDPDGPNFGIGEPSEDMGEGKGRVKGKTPQGDARTTTLDELGLKKERVFGYWFDFGDHWYHQAQVERIEEAIPTVTYPRLIKRVGKSPPQYADE